MRKLLTTATAALWWLCLIVQPAYAQGACYQWCVINASGSKTTFCSANPEAAYTAFLNAQEHGLCGGGASLPRTVYQSGTGTETSKIYNFHTPGCDGSPGPYYNTSGGFGPLQVVRETAECENTCATQAGQSSQLNFTVGYSRNPEDDRMAVVVDRPWEREGSTACYQGCQFTIGAPDRAWWSMAPTSSGLYRASVDMNVTQTATACTTDEPSVSQAQPDGPTCPGATMKVGEKTVCAGTAQNPVHSDQNAGTPGGGQGERGNPPAGSTGTGGGGPGRTPTVGVGGPAGGPVGATGAVGGGGGTGTVPTPTDGQEQAACGAPGQPPCRIDETGTPRDGATRLDGAGTAVDTTKQGVLDAITAHKDLQAPAWSWTFQLPTGCTPFYLAAFDMTIDICQWQSMIHDLMALVWIGATIWGCIALVGRTLGGPA